MKLPKNAWIIGALVTLLIIALPIAYVTVTAGPKTIDPWDGLPDHPAHTDHAGLFTDPLTTGPEVTAAWPECHGRASRPPSPTRRVARRRADVGRRTRPARPGR